MQFLGSIYGIIIIAGIHGVGMMLLSILPSFLVRIFFGDNAFMGFTKAAFITGSVIGLFDSVRCFFFWKPKEENEKYLWWFEMLPKKIENIAFTFFLMGAIFAIFFT